MPVTHTKGWATQAGLMLLALVAIGSTAMPAHAQNARVDRIEIVESGFYTATTTAHKPDASSPTGFSNTVADIVFLKKDPAVTAKLGTRMGVRFKVIGSPGNGTAQIRELWLIPAPGINNPKTGNVYRQFTEEFTATIGATRLKGYSFSDTWEIIKGRWTIQLWHGNRKLLEKSFLID